MELRLIQRLVQIMQSGEVTELELDDQKAGLHLRLRRGGEAPPAVTPVVHVTQGPAPPPPSPPVAAPASPEAPPPVVGTPFASPMVGTFYRAASPEAEPFVQVGSTVKPETVLCIIEAMKVMNEIKAETAGQIAEILVENGEPVEFGQPLFLIRKT